MNKKSHIIYSSIVLIGLWIICRFIFNKEYFTITLVIAAIPICLYNDIDTSINALGHRNLFFHSIILWVIIFLFNPTFLFILFIFASGLHCLLDVRYNSSKRTGFYTIKIWMRLSLSLLNMEKQWKTLWGMSGAWSTVWLILQFLISIIFMGWFLYVY